MFPPAIQFKPTGQVTYEKEDGQIASMTVPFSPVENFPVETILRGFYRLLRSIPDKPKKNTPLLLKGEWQPLKFQGFLRVSADEASPYNAPPPVLYLSESVGSIDDLLTALVSVNDIQYRGVQMSSAHVKTLLGEFERLRSLTLKEKTK